jgi:phage recombination protein Bet
MALAWCRATGRDPMKKPIHIVPMKVKDQYTGQWEWRDMLMPGIGTYRTDAANTGQYVGQTEPEFGPVVTGDFDGQKVRHPEWCRVTVFRLIGGEPRAFTAREYWIENYATGKEGKGVNAMWTKRAFGQIAKCAEAQALRKAFPDETGSTNSMEEMEGKTFDGVVEDLTPPPPKLERPASAPKKEPPSKMTNVDWISRIEPDMDATPTQDALDALLVNPRVKEWSATFAGADLDRWHAIIARNMARLHGGGGVLYDTETGEVLEE